MSQLRTFLTRLVAIFRRRHHEAGLHDEIATHLELLAADYRARGLSRADAQAAARRDFGGVDQVKETVRAQLSASTINCFLPARVIS